MRVWILGVFCLCGVAQAQSPRAPLGPWPGPGFQRGVVYSSWDGSYPAEQAWRGHLARFKELGIDALEVLTFAHQPAVDGPEIRADRADFPVAFITAARAAGFRILLKPHVWSRQFYDGSGRWRGSIQMPDAERWAAWFQAYEAFIVAQARQAAALGVEIFSVGLEYVEATRGHDAEWRRVIAAVRAVYPGLLTYSADYNHEIGHIAFWDALDVIGVNGYMKLADEDSPGAVALAIGISPHFVRIGALATRFGKPVLFTEVGFPSVTTAARLPWQWPRAARPSTWISRPAPTGRCWAPARRCRGAPASTGGSTTSCRSARATPTTTHRPASPPSRSSPAGIASERPANRPRRLIRPRRPPRSPRLRRRIDPNCPRG
ncbi:MAG: hypothetical protein R3F60_08045 [bacterium]